MKLVACKCRSIQKSRLVSILLLLAFYGPELRALSNTEYDSYKVKGSAFWFYSNPTGSFQGSNDTTGISLTRDFGFNSYSTFTGKFDSKFAHKNHFYVIGSSFDQSRQAVLTRDITFKGQTYVAGLTVRANLSAPAIAPGYQYDFIRRKRGYLGGAIQIDLFDASASLSAAAQIVNGTQQAAISGKQSLLAPIPIAGPVRRLYLTNSPRLYIDGNVYGMYLFGYGNFVSTADYLGVGITNHLSLNAATSWDRSWW